MLNNTDQKENSSSTADSATLAMDAAFEGSSTMEPGGSTTMRMVDGVLTPFNAIGLESTLDHQHVSKVWQENGCTPAPKFFSELVASDESKYDVSLSDGDVRLSDTLTLKKMIQDKEGNDVETTTDSNGNIVTKVGFTPHGLVTLTNTAGIPSNVVEYLTSDASKYDSVRTSRVATLANLINQDLDIRNVEWENPGTDMKKARRGVKATGKPEPRNIVLRLRDDSENKPVVRAVVSEKYTRELSNLEVFSMMKDCFNEDDFAKMLVSHYEHDGDDMIGNLLIPDYLQSYEGDSDYGIGIAFRNSEVKRYIWEIRPFAFRAICRNGCIWGRRDAKYFISKKHLGDADLPALRIECKKVIDLALSHGQLFLERMQDTRQVEVTDVPRILAQIGKEKTITRNQLRTIATAYNAEPEFAGTGFGVVQAITRAAQDFDPGTRNHLEAIGGDIIAPSLNATLDEVQTYWKRLGERAERYDDAEVDYIKVALAVA